MFILEIFLFIAGKLISVPVSEESLAFFGLQQIIDNDNCHSPNLESSSAFMSTKSVQHGMNFYYIVSFIFDNNSY